MDGSELTPLALPAGTSLRFAGRGLHCPEGISKQRNDEAECLRLCRQCPFPRHRGAPKYDSGKRFDRLGIAGNSCAAMLGCQQEASQRMNKQAETNVSARIHPAGQMSASCSTSTPARSTSTIHRLVGQRRKLIRMSDCDSIRSGGFPILWVLGLRAPARVGSTDASEDCVRQAPRSALFIQQTSSRSVPLKRSMEFCAVRDHTSLGITLIV